jgi:hypothetical protein
MRDSWFGAPPLFYRNNLALVVFDCREHGSRPRHRRRGCGFARTQCVSGRVGAASQGASRHRRSVASGCARLHRQELSGIAVLRPPPAVDGGALIQRRLHRCEPYWDMWGITADRSGPRHGRDLRSYLKVTAKAVYVGLEFAAERDGGEARYRPSAQRLPNARPFSADSRRRPRRPRPRTGESRRGRTPSGPAHDGAGFDRRIAIGAICFPSPEHRTHRPARPRRCARLSLKLRHALASQPVGAGIEFVVTVAFDPEPLNRVSLGRLIQAAP